jgi:hypothetical protein
LGKFSCEATLRIIRLDGLSLIAGKWLELLKEISGGWYGRGRWL